MRQWLWLSSVSRAVASNARGPRFKSSYQQNIKLDIYVLTVNYIEKTKNKEKEAGNGPFFRKGQLRPAIWTIYHPKLYAVIASLFWQNSSHYNTGIKNRLLWEGMVKIERKNEMEPNRNIQGRYYKCSAAVNYNSRIILKVISQYGNGCASVGRVVASNTRGPQFESRNWQKFI